MKFAKALFVTGFLLILNIAFDVIHHFAFKAQWPPAMDYINIACACAFGAYFVQDLDEPKEAHQ